MRTNKRNRKKKRKIEIVFILKLYVDRIYLKLENSEPKKKKY